MALFFLWEWLESDFTKMSNFNRESDFDKESDFVWANDFDKDGDFTIYSYFHRDSDFTSYSDFTYYAILLVLVVLMRWEKCLSQQNNYRGKTISAGI